MQQSNVIFGALLIAFIMFITLRGELQTYISLLRGSGTPANQPLGVNVSVNGQNIGGINFGNIFGGNPPQVSQPTAVTGQLSSGDLNNIGNQAAQFQFNSNQDAQDFIDTFDSGDI